MKILFFFLLTIIALPTWSESTSESSTINTSQHHSGIQAGGSLNTNSTNDTTIAGANLEAKDVNITTGGDLNVESQQDITTAHSEHQSITAGNNMGFAVGESNENTAWVNSQTSIIGENSVVINSDNTSVKGAVIANQKSDGTDGGNLVINTNTLDVSNVAGHDYQDSASVSVGLTGGVQEQIQGNASGGGNGTIKLGYGDSEVEREQIAYATIGQGTVSELTENVNRDINQTTKITKDENYNYDINLQLDGEMLGIDVGGAISNIHEGIGDVAIKGFEYLFLPAPKSFEATFTESNSSQNNFILASQRRFAVNKLHEEGKISDQERDNYQNHITNTLELTGDLANFSNGLYLSGIAGTMIRAGLSLIGLLSKKPQQTYHSPDFIVDSSGQAFPVPSGAYGPKPTYNSNNINTGVSFNGGRINNIEGVDMRIMSPNRLNPQGYIRYQKPQVIGKPQGVSPYTGKPGSNPNTHFSLSSGVKK